MRLCLDEEILALDLDAPRPNPRLRRPPEYGTGGHVELAAVTWAGDRRAVQVAGRKRATAMGACVDEGQESPIHVRYSHWRAIDVEGQPSRRIRRRVSGQL